MKLYTFRVNYKTRHKAMSEDSWVSRVSFLYIVRNNKVEARKSALNRYNKMINRDYSKSLYERERVAITAMDSQPIYSDGFLDIYI